MYNIDDARTRTLTDEITEMISQQLKGDIMKINVDIELNQRSSFILENVMARYCLTEEEAINKLILEALEQYIKTE